MHEAQLHKENSFITLTYSDEHLPPGQNLRHRDVQLFIKRLRKHLARLQGAKRQRHLTKIHLTPLQRDEGNSQPKAFQNSDSKPAIRYYMCGEYGEKTRRPHYHMCLFGYDFKDKKYWSTSGSTIKSKLYTSETLEKLWGKGNCKIGEVTFESAAYTARYIMKKVTGQAAANHYQNIDADTGEIIKRHPEYTRMSLKPGIGHGWLRKYASDAYPEGQVVVRGVKTKTPRYYDNQWKKMNPLEYEDLLFEREKAGQKRNHDNTKERLATKEIVAKAKIAFLKRTAH